jgi:hypothetical protein
LLRGINLSPGASPLLTSTINIDISLLLEALTTLSSTPVVTRRSISQSVSAAERVILSSLSLRRLASPPSANQLGTLNPGKTPLLSLASKSTRTFETRGSTQAFSGIS